MFSRILRLYQKTLFVIRYQGFAVAWRKANRKLRQKLSAMVAESSPISRSDEGLFSVSAEISVQELLHKRWSGLQPIANLLTAGQRIRLNLVMDNVTEKSLLGAAAYPLILTSLLAGRNDYDLRIISRNSVCNPTRVTEFFKIFAIMPPTKVEFYVGCQRDHSARALKLEVSEQDVFLATSWQSAYAVDQTNRRERFFYIVQEIETLYTPSADDRMLCNKIWANENIDFLLASRQLWDYFNKMDNNANLIKNGSWFEPVLARQFLFPGEFSLSQKKKYVLLFDGRPDPRRNLFFSALEYLDDAITAGIIDEDYWDIVVFGTDIPAFTFSNGLKPIFKQQLTWPEYLEFAKTVDLAFCLVEDAYPVCPAVDLVCAGAVVLTGYRRERAAMIASANHIQAEMNQSSMLAGFREAVDLAWTPERRKSNYEAMSRKSGWNSTVSTALDFMAARLQER